MALHRDEMGSPFPSKKGPAWKTAPFTSGAWPVVGEKIWQRDSKSDDGKMDFHEDTSFTLVAR